MSRKMIDFDFADQGNHLVSLLHQQRNKQLWTGLCFFTRSKEINGDKNFRNKNTLRLKVKREERSLQKLKDTKRYECLRQVHDIHKYFDKISVSLVCFVCPTWYYHICIGFSWFCMRFFVFAVLVIFSIYYYFHTTIKYIKGTVGLRPQIAKAYRGGRSYTQSVVKPVIIKLQQYNNIRLNKTMLN